jgi:hypothetical protein
LENKRRKLLLDKEKEWHLKSRAIWLEVGDENTNSSTIMQIVGKIPTQSRKLTEGMGPGLKILMTLLLKGSPISKIFLKRTTEPQSMPFLEYPTSSLDLLIWKITNISW